MDDKKASKSVKSFSCKNCDYECSRSCDWYRHLTTSKHNKRTKSEKIIVTNTNISKTIFTCDCGREYKHRQGLWKHSKVCQNTDDKLKYFSNNEELIQAVLKDNKEFKQLLIEQNAKIIELASKNIVITPTEKKNETKTQL